MMTLLINCNSLKPEGIRRRKLLTQFATGLVTLVLPWPVKTWAVPYEGMNVALKALPDLPAVEEPLLIMREFQSDTDAEIKRQIYRDIAAKKDLLRQLQHKFGRNQNITLTMENMEIRLLYVPELREQYRTAFENYCRNIITHILKKTQTANFYQQIISPSRPLPLTPNGGISAFLVHRLGKEYRVKCRFGTENGQTVRYLFEGACFSNRLGAVEVSIENPTDGVFRIDRRENTIWQNRCDNFYSLLQVPVEETLHYIVGPFTDRKLLADLKARKRVSIAEAERLAGDWMAVEEALVGGLGHLILTEYASKYSPAFSTQEVQQAWQAESVLTRYKYRKTGVELALALGFSRTFELYKTDPQAFLKQLIEASASSNSSI